MSYASEVLADSPIAWWTNSDLSGTTMVDVVGGHDGTYYGGPTLGALGLIPGSPSNRSVELDGATQYGEVLPGSWMDTTGVTFEVWFISTDGDSPLEMLVSTWDGIDFYRDQSTGFLRFSWNGGQDEIPIVITLGVPHHAVLACDGTDLKIYLDGDEVYSNTGFSPLSPRTHSLLFGAGKFPFTPNYFLQGSLGGVVLYDYMLDGTRVAAHYAAGMTPAPPEGYLNASAPATASFAGTFAGPSFTGSMAATNLVGTAAFEGTTDGLVAADTSNFMSGLSIRATASVTVTVPVAAPVAGGLEYDAAILRPTPTIVNGRPT